MKKHTLAAATAISLLFAASQAEALYIADNYWGGGVMSINNPATIIANDGIDTSDASPARSGDVYDPILTDTGSGFGYDISGMDVSILNGTLTVKIYSDTGNYFGNWLSNKSTAFAPGDLFLSTTGWNPLASSTDTSTNGEPNYNTDGAGVGTSWDFVVALEGVSTSTKGTSNLYSTATANGNISYGTLRNAQEAWFSPSIGATSVGSGDWQIVSSDNANPYLLITTSLTNEMQNVREWGLHWTMECANDVIEGSFSPVPEPATALLFGAGLAGLAAFGRRRGRN